MRKVTFTVIDLPHVSRFLWYLAHRFPTCSAVFWFCSAALFLVIFHSRPGAVAGRHSGYDRFACFSRIVFRRSAHSLGGHAIVFPAAAVIVLPPPVKDKPKFTNESKHDVAAEVAVTALRPKLELLFCTLMLCCLL